MKKHIDDEYTKAGLNESEPDRQGKCPDNPSESTCGSCQGCSGQAKRTSTVYYIIPALIIVVTALILKHFGII
jgi:hypothetical protein